MKNCFDLIFSDKSLKPLQLSEVRRSGRPNDAFFADESDATAKADERAALIAGGDIKEVRAIIRSFALDEKKGIEREVTETSGLYIIRTPLLRFPDGFYFWLETTDGGVKVSLYSRSVYGYSDIGVNRKRIESVLERLGDSPTKKER